MGNLPIPHSRIYHYGGYRRFLFYRVPCLIAFIATGLAVRLWWLRRKLRKTAEAEVGEYTVIEDAEIIEESTRKPDGK